MAGFMCKICTQTPYVLKLYGPRSWGLQCKPIQLIVIICLLKDINFHMYIDNTPFWSKLEIVLYTLFVPSCPTVLNGLQRTVSTFTPCLSEFIWTKLTWCKPYWLLYLLHKVLHINFNWKRLKKQITRLKLPHSKAIFCWITAIKSFLN